MHRRRFERLQPRLCVRKASRWPLQPQARASGVAGAEAFSASDLLTHVRELAQGVELSQKQRSEALAMSVFLFVVAR
jgi:hypothetical protein